MALKRQPLSKFPHHTGFLLRPVRALYPIGWSFEHHTSKMTVDRLLMTLTCNRSTYTAEFQWNRVSSLERSGTDAETLPLSYRGPLSERKIKSSVILTSPFEAARAAETDLVILNHCQQRRFFAQA
ncbi:hypothetical protein AVEN_162813-1 [Araneus ventricosus]|uniref:Uncharacterized protein n=1 Tax=Araneus ventricosus TaxID=182803 RepID=A0A4Y2C618_ARAVE|nr:hypothetical protein AVEN_162813-1 [Araneus ventricosus]